MGSRLRSEIAVVHHLISIHARQQACESLARTFLTSAPVLLWIHRRGRNIAYMVAPGQSGSFTTSTSELRVTLLITSAFTRAVHVLYLWWPYVLPAAQKSAWAQPEAQSASRACERLDPAFTKSGIFKMVTEGGEG
eukprot:scaffold27312_cov31-Tisochrysis_lutea.AAC.4